VIQIEGLRKSGFLLPSDKDTAMRQPSLLIKIGELKKEIA